VCLFLLFFPCWTVFELSFFTWDLFTRKCISFSDLPLLLLLLNKANLSNPLNTMIVVIDKHKSQTTLGSFRDCTSATLFISQLTAIWAYERTSRWRTRNFTHPKTLCSFAPSNLSIALTAVVITTSGEIPYKSVYEPWACLNELVKSTSSGNKDVLSSLEQDTQGKSNGTNGRSTEVTEWSFLIMENTRKTQSPLTLNEVDEALAFCWTHKTRNSFFKRCDYINKTRKWKARRGL